MNNETRLNLADENLLVDQIFLLALKRELTALHSRVCIAIHKAQELEVSSELGMELRPIFLARKEVIELHKTEFSLQGVTSGRETC